MSQPSILLPSWHLEDVSRDLNERDSSAILNAYAISLHPWVLASSHYIPRWGSAPSPGESEPDRIVIIPEPSLAKLPSGWLNQAEAQGVIVLKATSDRQETLNSLKANNKLRELLQRQPLPPDHPERNLDEAPSLEDSFLALGTVYLLTTLLSQAMYHYDNIDETRFSEFLLNSARHAVSQSSEICRQEFQQACEQLLESREKFYPVEAHLIDLCLLGESAQDADVKQMTQTDHQLNVLMTAEYLEQLSNRNPEIVQELKSAFQQEKLSLLGGEYQESPTPLLPLQTLRWQLLKGREVYQQHLGVEPDVWMRMRYGLSTQLPLMLKKMNIHSAYHLVLDDGHYPDEEQSHFTWEGRSSSTIQSISRIPLSIENAASLLKIPERMAEAMNHDHLACVVLAHWPKLKNPWFQDLVKIQEYAPVLGRFARLDQFLRETEASGQYTCHEQRFYQTPYLDQYTGRKQNDPISRFAHFWKLQTCFQSLQWFTTTRQILSQKPDNQPLLDWENKLQAQANELRVENLKSLQQDLEHDCKTAAEQLAKTLTSNAAGNRGFLVLNPLCQITSAVLKLPYQEQGGQKLVPKLSGAVKHLQLESDHVLASVELPSSGFAALEMIPASQFKPPRTKAPLAGETFLQNEFFHVMIDKESGGIQRLRLHGSADNLLSQRLVFRLDGSSGSIPRNPSWGQSSAEPTYTRMVSDSIQVTKTGPVVGEITVRGRLLIPDSEKVVADFEQTYRVHRGSRNLQVETQLSPKTLPSAMSDRSYYALRSAWASSAATVRGTLQQSQFPIGERRLESSGPIEIQDDDQRVTLIPHFLPFHQRTAPRMLDTLLIVQGENTRHFQFDVSINPIQSASAAAEAETSPLVVPVEHLPGSASAWLFHLSAPSIQLIGMQAELPKVPEELAKLEGGTNCYRFDFVETSGVHTVAHFSLFRKPKKAWEVNLLGEIQSEVPIEGDRITLDFLPCDYLSLRVLF